MKELIHPFIMKHTTKNLPIDHADYTEQFYCINDKVYYLSEIHYTLE